LSSFIICFSELAVIVCEPVWQMNGIEQYEIGKRLSGITAIIIGDVKNELADIIGSGVLLPGLRTSLLAMILVL
jgi:hypothetical protein